MLKEFKEFALRGNVLDMAVGIIIGAAFGKIVTSFVKDVLMPPLGMLLGQADFTNFFINLSGQPYATLAEAQEAGAATINYGVFVNTVVDFLLVALAIFLLIRQVNRMMRKETPPPPPNTKDCPFCLSKVALKASRCAFCTSELEAA